MLGKPSKTKPVFICSMAGPWVLLRAVREWTKAMSSTHPPRWGSRSEIDLPHWPRREKFHGLCIRLAVAALKGDDVLAAGQRLAVTLFELGFVLPGVEVADRAGAENLQDAFCLGREVGGFWGEGR